MCTGNCVSLSSAAVVKLSFHLLRCRPFFLALTAIALMAGVQSRGWRKRTVLLLLLTCAVAFSDVVLREYNDGAQIPSTTPPCAFLPHSADLLVLVTWADRNSHVAPVGYSDHASNWTARHSISVRC